MNDLDALMRYIHQENGVWVFRIWTRAPGPDLDDFIVYFSTREEALEAVRAYLYWGPTIIEDWIVPLYQHPELSAEGVYLAILDAVNISQDAFEGIQERRYERASRQWHLRRINRWERALQSTFLSLKHSHDPSTILGLRRDMQESYIVHLNETFR